MNVFLKSKDKKNCVYLHGNINIFLTKKKQMGVICVFKHASNGSDLLPRQFHLVKFFQRSFHFEVFKTT